MTDIYFDSEAEFRKGAKDIAPSRTLTDAEKTADLLQLQQTYERQEMRHLTRFVPGMRAFSPPAINGSTYFNVIPAFTTLVSQNYLTD